MKYRFDCKDFNGYKPCRPGWVCDTCRHYTPRGFRILIINIDALGDVLMTTALLPAIKRRYPVSSIFWVTSVMGAELLRNNPYIDEIFPYSPELLSWLPFMRFDLVLSCDRDRKSTALAMAASAAKKRGFGLAPSGVIIPLNEEFHYAYQLGLDDELKFRKNAQKGQQILAEGLGFDYARDEYVLELTKEEYRHIASFREIHDLSDVFVLGVNTGCSNTFPYKKLPFRHTISLLENILSDTRAENMKILLLGGKAETELNRRIADTLDDARVIQTPTTEGIRRGIHYIACCNACLTGDTFGMHAAIALKVPVVVYFTISCEVEIDLYGRGVKITADVPCRPCWKSVCDNPICIDRINLKSLEDGVWQLYETQGDIRR